MPVVHKIQILQKLITPLSTNRRYIGLAAQAATVRVGNAKRKLMKDFEDHNITKDLRSGSQDPSGDHNLAGTLGSSHGNLFSFIGFNAGEDPVEEVKTELDKIQLRKIPLFSRRQRNGLAWGFGVETPSFRELYKKFPYPKSDDGSWAGGSWLQGIERGISGLMYYLRGAEFLKSRSGGGIQTAKNQVRNFEYSPVRYMTEIFEKFKKNIKARKDF